MQTYFDRFTINITKDDASSGSHQGPCDEDIAYLVDKPTIRRQLDKINPEDIADELQEYGAWDETELSDHDQNRHRIIWIACGNITEEIAQKP